MPPGAEDFASKFGGGFHQRHDLEVVGTRMAGRIGCHVGKHNIGGPAYHFFELIGCSVIEEIELDEVDSRHRLHRQDVNRDHSALFGRADPFGSNFAPTPRSGAEINNARTFFEEVRLVVHLHQFVRRPRAHALPLGASNVRVIELTLQPLT